MGFSYNGAGARCCPMCLAVSGRILLIASQPPASAEPGVGSSTPWPGAEAEADDPLWRVAEVDFGGVRQQVSLACLPQAQVGDQVLVHVGLAIALVQENGEDAGAARHDCPEARTQRR